MLNDGAIIIGEPERKAQTIEDCKSFSFHLSLKNPDGSPQYQSAVFFQSRKYCCRPEDEEAAAREAFDWCMGQVTEDIRAFNEIRARKQASIERRSNAA